MISSFKRRMPVLAAACLFVCASAQAFCLPPTKGGMPQVAASQNPRGCWAGWWCSPSSAYVIAATKQQCDLVGNQRAFAAWVMAPDPQRLPFSADFRNDAALSAVWKHERAKLDALRPR